MRALLLAWGHHLLDSKQVADNADEAVEPANGSPAAWPVSWGTAGQPEGNSPFCHLLYDKLPHFKPAVPQKTTTLCTPPGGSFLDIIFSPQGSDFQAGFAWFEPQHEFAVWRVAVPTFEASDESDDTYTRVPFQLVSKDYMLVSQVMQMRILKDYLVCTTRPALLSTLAHLVVLLMMRW